MLEFWKTWMEAVRFASEAQAVVCMRLMVISAGGRRSSQEAMRMVAEKFVAFAEAEIAATDALVNGHGLLVAAERAYTPVRQRVHDNSRRLLGGARHSRAIARQRSNAGSTGTR